MPSLFHHFLPLRLQILRQLIFLRQDLSAAKNVAAVASSRSLSSIILSSALPPILPPSTVAPPTLQHSLLSLSLAHSPPRLMPPQQQGTSPGGQLIPQLLSERIERKAGHPRYSLNLDMLQLLHSESLIKAVLAAVFAAAKAVQLALSQGAEGRLRGAQGHQQGRKEEGAGEAECDDGSGSHFSGGGIGRGSTSEGSDARQGAQRATDGQQELQQQKAKALEREVQTLLGFAMAHSRR